jgi:hypothetical protein
MICPRCQVQNPHHAAFCLGCGFKVELLKDTPAPSASLRNGLATASLIIGAISFCTVSFFLVGAITSMVLGVVALVKSNSQPDEYGGRGRAIGGIALSGLSVIAGFWVAFDILPRFYQEQIAKNEYDAYAAVKHVGWCQARFFEKNLRFATLEELEAADLIARKTVEQKANDSGYLIEVRLREGRFEVVATPIDYAVTGRMSFYMTSDYYVHAADKRGREADADDPTYY